MIRGRRIPAGGVAPSLRYSPICSVVAPCRSGRGAPRLTATNHCSGTLRRRTMNAAVNRQDCSSIAPTIDNDPMPCRASTRPTSTAIASVVTLRPTKRVTSSRVPCDSGAGDEVSVFNGRGAEFRAVGRDGGPRDGRATGLSDALPSRRRHQSRSSWSRRSSKAREHGRCNSRRHDDGGGVNRAGADRARGT